MPLSSTADITYQAACEFAGCTNTWSGKDLADAKAAGWTHTCGTWGLGDPPPSVMVHCPAHTPRNV